MQSFNTFWVQGIREQGKILVPGGNAKVSFIDAWDIAAIVAKLPTTDDKNNRAFNITGPESIDHDEVAAVLSAVTGKKITYQNQEDHLPKHRARRSQKWPPRCRFAGRFLQLPA